MAHTGLSATALARKAQLAPSTLQKPLNEPGHTGMISGRSIAKIAEVAGVRPMEYPARRPGMAEPEATPYEPPLNRSAADHTEQAIAELRAGRNGRDPFVMHGYTLELAGILPGDIMIVDLNKQAKAGDIVCAQIYDWAQNRAETVMRVFDPPFLVVRSMRDAHQKPLMVDHDRVVIKGVVISTLRQIHAA